MHSPSGTVSPSPSPACVTSSSRRACRREPCSARTASAWVWARANTAPLERIDLIEAVRSANRPKVGAVADDFDEKDEVGARFHLQSHLALRPVLLGAFCTCSVCERTVRKWNELVQRYRRRFSAAAFISLEKDDPVIEYSTRLKTRFSLVPDPAHTLCARYPGPGQGSEGLGCPRAWVIGKDGRYRYVMPMGSEPTPQVMAELTHALGLHAR